MNTKKCGGCGETKPTTEFSRNKRRRDGLQTWCKQCCAKASSAWHEANKNYHAELNSAWYEANKDRIRAHNEANRELRAEYDRDYRKANKQRITERDRTRHEVNREQDLERARIWREANPGRIAELSRSWRKANPRRAAEHSRNRRARKRNARGSHNHTDIQKQYDAQKGKCYYCGVKVGDTYHIDHVIPLAKGGSNGPENLVIACPTCNISKGAKLPHEWSQGGRLL